MAAQGLPFKALPCLQPNLETELAGAILAGSLPSPCTADAWTWHATEADSCVLPHEKSGEGFSKRAQQFTEQSKE